MSGHSKWAQIKRQKGAADKKRGQVFSKLSRSIQLAAKDGADPETNYKLRLEMERAKAAGMPQDSVRRAVRRGTGEEKSGKIENVIYEGYGPGGAAFYVQTATENRNRTTANIRHIFTKHGGNLGSQGSVSHIFEARGQILSPKKENRSMEDISLAAIDLGALDVVLSEEGLEIYTRPEDLQAIKDGLARQAVLIASFEAVMRPQTAIEPSGPAKSQIEKLTRALEEDEDVIAVHTNASL